MGTTFIAAASILFREGLEAILVLVALAAYLTRVGAQDRVRALWSGAVLAVLASVGTAWVFEKFYNGAHSDLLEGTLVLISAALMFYVSGWLYVKQDPRVWQAYLKSQTDKAVAANSALAIGSLAFFAVVREGGETILFLHSLAGTSGGWSAQLIAGIAAAALALAGVFFIVLKSTRKIPLRAVFLVTSAFLFLMGLKFIGEGLQEFQEQAWVPSDTAPYADWLTAIGLNPTWEALATQVAVALMALAAVAWTRRGSTTAVTST